MHELLQQIFSGLAAGAIYASVALALVMIYRATDLVNFAQGEMAMFSTYIAWSLVTAGLPFWAAFLITLVASFLGGMAIERIIIRPVENAPVLAAVIVTIGLVLIFNSLAGWIYSYTVQDFPSPFPDRPLFGALMTTQELGVVGVTLVMLTLLFLFFRFTKTGLAMRAAAQNPESARLCGIPVGRMLAIGWGLAAAIGATAGIMVAPVLFLDPYMMSGVLLYAFAGALLGGIQSRRRPGRRGDRRRHREPGRHLSHSDAAQADRGAGVDCTRAGVQAERFVRHCDRAAGVTMEKLRIVSPDTPAADRYAGLTADAWRWLGTTALIAVALLPFALSNYHVFELTMVMIYAIAVLGLNILTGYNGQISLGHGGFFAVGAYTTAILMHHYAVPYWATLPPAALICFVLGVLFGLPALRFEGPYLALVTLAMAVATPQVLKYFDNWTGGQQGSTGQTVAAGGARHRPRPLALFHHAARPAAGDPGRGQLAPRPHRPRPGGDPRPSDRGGRHGHRHRPLQDARFRHQHAVHRRRRRALRDRHRLRLAGELHLVPVDFLPGGLGDRRHRDNRRRNCRWNVHPIRAQSRQRYFRCRALGALRGGDAAVHVRHAARRRRYPRTSARAVDAAESRHVGRR